jgi:hypothetical protein
VLLCNFEDPEMDSTDFLIDRLTAAPERIQEQVMGLLFSRRAVSRELASFQCGDDTGVRSALESKSSKIIRQVEDLLDPPPKPAA